MHISIPECTHNTLLKSEHPSPKNPEDALFKADPKQYRAKGKFAKE